MVILTVQQLEKGFAGRTLFEGLDFGLHAGERIGLIGANGAGKSTLLKILAGHMTPDDGEVIRNRSATVEYLSQRPDLREDCSALEEVLTDGPEAFAVLQAYEQACHQLEVRPGDEAAMARVTELGDEMDRVDGWSVEGEARAILAALGLEDWHQLVGEMSGGQKKRVALARALLRPADLLILDEPTNHLDVETIEWLETYLQQRAQALLLVTHDRYFLDRVTTVILELSEQSIWRHEGNYSEYLESRAERRELQRKREQRRQQRAKQELEWLRRGPKARTSKSKARIDRAHALLDEDYSPEEHGEVSMDLKTARLGKKVMEVEGVSKAYGDEVVLRDFSYVFTRRERLGIVGPNGVGKSTLLNILTGRASPDAGEVDVGETVVFGYYDQESQELDESVRVHDYISKVSERVETADGTLSAAQMLERFLFSRQRQWDPIKKLSGGERRRLYLLRVLMQQPNVLLLDEPTNDLDVETLTVLEEYLDEFAGVLIVVSHDRYFLDRTVDHLLVYQDDRSLVEYPGGYSSWLEARDAERAEAAAAKREAQRAERAAQPAAPTPTPKGRLSYMEQRELDELEPRIAELEDAIAEADEEMATRHDDYEELQNISERKDALVQELEEALERWMELEEKLEG